MEINEKASWEILNLESLHLRCPLSSNATENHTKLGKSGHKSPQDITTQASPLIHINQAHRVFDPPHFGSPQPADRDGNQDKARSPPIHPCRIAMPSQTGHDLSEHESLHAPNVPSIANILTSSEGLQLVEKETEPHWKYPSNRHTRMDDASSRQPGWDAIGLSRIKTKLRASDSLYSNIKGKRQSAIVIDHRQQEISSLNHQTMPTLLCHAPPCKETKGIAESRLRKNGVEGSLSNFDLDRKSLFFKNPLSNPSSPKPSALYKTIAHTKPKFLPALQQLLIVLDLNGTLIRRQKSSKNFTTRPYLRKFLEYCLANHSVMIWSSAQPSNVDRICGRIFKPAQRSLLIGEWARDTLGLTPAQYLDRVQVYKTLDRIWGNSTLQSMHPRFRHGERWGQHNTVLVDDSATKAISQPFNHVEVPEFAKGSVELEGDGKEILGQVVGWLEEARKWDDVSAFVGYLQRRFMANQGWTWDRTPEMFAHSALDNDPFKEGTVSL